MFGHSLVERVGLTFLVAATFRELDDMQAMFLVETASAVVSLEDPQAETGPAA
ncbi:MAG: hypothetical protein M3546_06245 [Actinomycetota bacterium]|nr:hypothetical protein [Actinomycetota bacterium]